MYNTIVDPPMVRLSDWSLAIAAAILAVIAIVIAVLAWLT